MWGVVNGGGTARQSKCRILKSPEKPERRKTRQLGKDVGANKDHAWFVSFAPAYKPEIAVLALIENSGFGGSTPLRLSKGVYEAYLQKNIRAY